MTITPELAERMAALIRKLNLHPAPIAPNAGMVGAPPFPSYLLSLDDQTEINEIASQLPDPDVEAVREHMTRYIEINADKLGYQARSILDMIAKFDLSDPNPNVSIKDVFEFIVDLYKSHK